MVDKSDLFCKSVLLNKSSKFFFVKKTRAIGAQFGDVDVAKTQISDIEENVKVQASTDDVMMKMADMLDSGGGTSDGGNKPVNEHKAIQQVRNFG